MNGNHFLGKRFLLSSLLLLLLTSCGGGDGSGGNSDTASIMDNVLPDDEQSPNNSGVNEPGSELNTNAGFKGSWEATVQVAGADTFKFPYPIIFVERSAVSLDCQGNAHILWMGNYHSVNIDGYDVYHEELHGARLTLDNNLVDKNRVQQASYNELGSGPHIALDIEGNAMAVWSHQYDWSRVTTSSYPVTASWENWELIDTSTQGDAYTPQIAIDIEGNAIAVWRQRVQTSSYGYDIWANRYTPIGGWGTPELIENISYQFAEAFPPKILMDAEGNAVVVWLQQGPSQSFNVDLYANHYNSSTGSWGSPVSIENLSGAIDNLEIAMDDAGNVIVVWLHGKQVYANRYDIVSGWQGESVISIHESYYIYEPEIAMDAAGNAIATWRQQADGKHHVWWSRYTDGVSWSTPKAMIDDPNLTQLLDRFRLVMDADGNAILTWVHGSKEMWFSTYGHESGWSSESVLFGGMEQNDSIQNPSLVMSPSGYAVLIWSIIGNQTPIKAQTLWAKRFTPEVVASSNTTFCSSAVVSN